MDRSKRENQSGYVLVVIMMVMSLGLLVILFMLDTSVMEHLTASNSLSGEQAFQLAEGGVYMAAEKVYENLSRDCRQQEILPATVSLDEKSIMINTEGKPARIQLRDPALLEQNSDYCIYEVISFGSCAPAKHGLKVWVRYDYLQFYAVSYDDDGSVTGMSFSHRQYLNRGEMVMMERITE